MFELKKSICLKYIAPNKDMKKLQPLPFNVFIFIVSKSVLYKYNTISQKIKLKDLFSKWFSNCLLMLRYGYKLLYKNSNSSLTLVGPGTEGMSEA